AIAESRTFFEAETVVQTLKGERLTLLFQINFPAPPADLDSVLVSITDITERKRAEYLTGQVFESSPDPVAIIGRDYRFPRVNPVSERYWGVTSAQAMHMTVADCVGLELFESTFNPLCERCFAGEDVSYSGWIPSTRGRRYVSATCTPLRPHSERVDALLMISRD